MTKSETDPAVQKPRAIGAEWAKKDASEIVGAIVADMYPPNIQTQAICEMTRRQVVATQTFNEQSTEQTRRVIDLTISLRNLTYALGFLAVIQIALAAWQIWGPR